MACWSRTQRVSVNDVFVHETRCDEGAYLWLVIDLSGPNGFVGASGHGPIPPEHLPLGASLDGVPWTEKLAIGRQHETPMVRDRWPQGTV